MSAPLPSLSPGEMETPPAEPDKAFPVDIFNDPDVSNEVPVDKSKAPLLPEADMEE
jgi:hypothetical protein